MGRLAQLRDEWEAILNMSKLNTLTNWFSEPFPQVIGNKGDYLKIIITSGFVLLIFWLVRPFGMSAMPEGIIIELLLKVGVLTALYSITTSILLPKYLIVEEQWEIKHQILSLIINVLGVALIIYLTMFDYLSNSSLTLTQLAKFVFMTIFFASPFIMLRVQYQKNRYLVYHQEQANSANKTLNSDQNTNNNEEKVQIVGNDGTFEISTELLIYAKSERNYMEFFYIQDGRLTSIVLRMTKSSALEQLNDIETIVDCHRSYLVNIITIESIKGNSRGYLLNLNFVANPIPVSRQKSKAIIKVIANYNSV